MFALTGIFLFLRFYAGMTFCPRECGVWNIPSFRVKCYEWSIRQGDLVVSVTHDVCYMHDVCMMHGNGDRLFEAAMGYYVL